MTRVKNCILHIGTEKTGSTSLQNWLALNRAQLLERGYYVPKSLTADNAGNTANHLALALMSIDDTVFDDMRRMAGVYGTQAFSEYKKQQFLNFSAELSSAPTTVHSVVLSSEHCHSRLLTDGEVDRLASFLYRFFEQVHLIVYLRPQYELALSFYGMQVLSGNVDVPYLPLMSAQPGEHRIGFYDFRYFDYHDLLSRWQRQLKPKRVSVRLLEEIENSDVIRDFQGLIDVDIKSNRGIARLNTNISEEAQSFLIYLTKSISTMSKSSTMDFNALRADICTHLLAHFPGRGRAPTRLQVFQFMRRFDVSNEHVRAEFFPVKKQLFNIDFDALTTKDDSHRLDAQQLSDFYVRLISESRFAALYNCR